MARKFVDMRRTQEEKVEAAMESMPSPMNQSEFPYGLCLSLDEESLEKLDLDATDVEIGDMIDIRMLGRVTSISKNEREGKSCCRIEIQGEQVALENEDTEEIGADEPKEPRMSPQRRRYAE